MTVETATHIHQLNALLPDQGDGVGEGDNHLRLLKAVIKNTFPNITGAVTVTHTDINNLRTKTAALDALAGLVPAVDRLPYFNGVSTAALATFSAYARTLIDDADAATARGTLGLGSLATLNSIGTSQLNDDAVTFAKLQNINTARLLGRTSASAGNVEEITAGNRMSLSSGSLNVSGKVLLQRLEHERTDDPTSSSNIPFDDTVPLSTEGVQVFSRAITPMSASSTIVVKLVAYAGINSTGDCAMVLFNGTTALAAASNTIDTGKIETFVIEHEEASGSTSARTYTVRMGPAAGETMRLNGQTAGRKYGGALKSKLIVEEWL